MFTKLTVKMPTDMTFEECANEFGLYDFNTKKCFKGDTEIGLKIIGIFMIKNEEKIIERMLASVADICDFIVITDTGSTDQTIDILNKSVILHDLYKSEFINFGESRTISFLNALDSVKRKKFDLKNTYGLLLDADMVFKLENKDEFYNILKNNTEYTSFSLEQRNGHLKYFNTRLIRMSEDWKCVGPTHEYWACTNLKNFNLHCAYIEDVNDGGCKTDKTLRDIKLLENAEKNDRNTFYLAQSYNDIGQYDKANQAYLLRLQYGGWSEELFYSYYQLCKNACKVKQYDKMELYGLQCHFQNRKRREPLIFMMREFRNIGMFEQANYYLHLAEKLTEPKNVLFSESNIYKDEVILFEKTILDYYLKEGKGLKYCWEYLNKYTDNFRLVHDNMKFYLNKVNLEEKIYLQLNPVGIFHPTTCSIIRYKNILIGNARYVNYVIEENFRYNWLEKKAKTKNYFIVLNDNYQTVMMNLIKSDDDKKIENYIEGLEDIRLYMENDQLKFYANTFDYTPHVTVVKGSYFPLCTVVEKVINTGKNEKNHFPYKNNFLEGAWKLPNATSSMFKHLRGSTPPVEFEGITYILFHGVIENKENSQIRVYYNVMCKVENEISTLSLPFKMSDFPIEYCLSFLIEKDHVWFSCSENDDTPYIAKMNFNELKKLFN